MIYKSSYYSSSLALLVDSSLPPTGQKIKYFQGSIVYVDGQGFGSEPPLESIVPEMGMYTGPQEGEGGPTGEVLVPAGGGGFGGSAGVY